jgi:hypothetical protein
MHEGIDDENRVAPTEEAGETTAADSVAVPADTRPVGEGTAVPVAGDEERGDAGL